MASQLGQCFERRDLRGLCVFEPGLEAMTIPRKDLVTGRAGRALHGVDRQKCLLQRQARVGRIRERRVYFAELAEQSGQVVRLQRLGDFGGSEQRWGRGPALRERWQLLVEATLYRLQEPSRLLDGGEIRGGETAAELTQEQRELGMPGERRRPAKAVQRGSEVLNVRRG